jgi:hypothetical protein
VVKKSSCLDEIEKLKQQREERRARMDEAKRTRTQREKDNANMGIKVDVDFQVLVERELLKVPEMRPVSIHVLTSNNLLSLAYSSRSVKDLRYHKETTHFHKRA